uniref:Poly [ADP-ribose] polymerase n=1 Tax=Ciona intestinalis TaxID=7719 RepID=F6U0A7_CIOIN
CNFIIHAVGPRWSDHSHSMCCSYLQSCINYSMEEAEKQQLNSIAIPAISCGVFGGDPSVCIPLIVNTVLDYFTQNRNSSINQVDFVEMTSDSILKDFVNALGALKVVEDEQSAILKVSPVKNQVVVVQKEAISQSDTLTLGSISISVSQGDLTRDNSDAIVNSTNPHFDLTQGMVSKAILKNGGQSILHECRNQQGHWNTPTLRVTSGGNLPCRYVFHIVTPNDIKQIATVLLEVFKTADMLGLATLAIPALGTGNLRIGGTKVAQCIRGAIKEYVDSNTPANLNTIKVVIFQQSMVAEFRKVLKDKGICICLIFKQNCHIISCNVPSNWEPMKDEGMIKVLIKPGTVEYNRVMSKFNHSKTIILVKQLERIQHKSQYKQFVAKKNEVESRMKKDNVQMEVVKELFHGTQFDVSEKIYVQGFDRNFAGANAATVYGKGVYFALNATYSSRYAAPNPNMGNQCKMFLADVVTGEYCLGNQNLIAPPPRQTASNKSQLYDSVVDNMASPTIYVVFKDASAYPKYLLTYTS